MLLKACTGFLYTLLTITSAHAGEAELNQAYCASIGGVIETKHSFTLPNGKKHHVYIDCETDEEVIEAGIDKRSSLDSVQQALFFASLTNKKPVVVIFDTDGVMGVYEYRIMMACNMVGVGFRSVKIE